MPEANSKPVRSAAKASKATFLSNAPASATTVLRATVTESIPRVLTIDHPMVTAIPDQQVAAVTHKVKGDFFPPAKTEDLTQVLVRFRQDQEIGGPANAERCVIPHEGVRQYCIVARNAYEFLFNLVFIQVHSSIPMCKHYITFHPGLK